MAHTIYFSKASLPARSFYYQICRHLRTTHWLFLAIAIIVGCTLVKMVPPFWGPDESSHFARTYQLTSGQLKATKMKDGTYGGLVPNNVISLYNTVAHNALNDPNIFMAENIYDRHDVSQPERYKIYLRQHLSTKLQDYDFPATANYTPLAYTGPIIGMSIGRIAHATLGTTLFLARSGTLFVYCLLLFGALYMLREKKIRWLVFVVGLMPNALIGASLVSTDSMVLGTSVLLFALLIRAKDELPASDTKKLMWALSIVTIVLPLTKPAYFPFALLTLLVSYRLWGTGNRGKLYKYGVVIISLLMLASWSLITKDISRTVAQINGPVLAAQTDTHRQILYLAHHPIMVPVVAVRTMLANDTFFTTGSIGSIGWNAAFIPTWLAALVFISMLAAAFYAADELSKLRNELLCMGIAGMVTFAAIFLIFYLTYTPVGSGIVLGIQGRYFDPLFVYVLTGLTAVLPITVSMSKRAAANIFGSSAASAAVLTVLFYASILW